MNNMQLSPLNFRGLIDTLGVVVPTDDLQSKRKYVAKRKALQCWRCPECNEVHDWESDAEECCAEPEGNPPHAAMSCPVCSQKAESHRDATDCCLWKDLDGPTRWAMADAVEAGGSWASQLGLAGFVEAAQP